MSATPIDFYIDFSSPYGYFASQKIEALAAKYDRTVRWHPLLLGVIFKQTGGAPLTEVPLKGEYSKRDFARRGNRNITDIVARIHLYAHSTESEVSFE